MSILIDSLSDTLHGTADSLSGWWVAVKCWRDEARKVSTRPRPPRAFEEIARKRQEAKGIRVEDKEVTLTEVIWNSVTTAGVALLITFCIQTVCSYIVSLCGDNFSSAIAISTWLLQFLWWFPSMAVIKITSIFNNNEIADKVFLYRYGKPKSVPFAEAIGEFIFSTIYQTIFLVQVNLVSMFIPWPWISVFLEWMHYALFYALYAFEYKWTSLGIPGHKRVAQIENNWVYYFAFGLPIHIAIIFWDSLYTRTMAFTLLFPFSILGATVASPPRPQFLFPIHIMFPSVFVTNEIHKFFHKYWQ